ncbi:recombinase family protein [Metapseudomonas resinovorans]|uniref:Putative recombinase n=1 Tax=Metapseudomonas resinovorans NBRC 106553 TaxID=1245471 RepID=S6ADX3_METRE|nr:recombinase family protein [Pseudomonas resinovorans]BAN47677.1 putative recombinase [Pseudomonas resinovorans NBRC 106553]
MNVVAYYRVSTRSQGESGLGLEAQQDYIRFAAGQQGWNVVAEYTDSGVSGSVHPLDRPEASKAFTHGLPVVVAKLDRLSRDVEHIAGLMKRSKFMVATMPKADTMQLHLYAMLAEQERTFISQRTKDGLASLQQRADKGDEAAQAKIANRDNGRKAANVAQSYKAAQAANRAKADNKALAYDSHIKAAMFEGVKTLSALAGWMNAKAIASPRGEVGKWQAVQVQRLLSRLEIKFP